MNQLKVSLSAQYFSKLVTIVIYTFRCIIVDTLSFKYDIYFVKERIKKSVKKSHKPSPNL